MGGGGGGERRESERILNGIRWGERVYERKGEEGILSEGFFKLNKINLWSLFQFINFRF